MKKSFFGLIVIALVGFIVLNFNDNETYSNLTNGEVLSIHYLDVGQGDSTFIELPNGKTMLIDAGEKSQGEVVKSYLDNLEIKTVDYLIGTHPHTDHIGGLAYIIESFEINNIYMPKATSTSKTYENLLETIKKKNLSVTSARSGVVIIDEDGLKVEVLSPIKGSYSGLNNYSVVLKISYGKNVFLFMGDAEELVEKEINGDVSADVIKVGHHGSITSSSEEFVARVKPKYAIISVGVNNKYDHPSEDILKRYEAVGAKTYRTDLNGNIVIKSDGEKIEVEVEKWELS